MKLLVGRNFKEASNWLHQPEHINDEIYIVTDPKNLYCIKRGTTIILLDSYYRNEHWREIERLIKLRFLQIKYA